MILSCHDSVPSREPRIPHWSSLFTKNFFPLAGLARIGPEWVGIRPDQDRIEARFETGFSGIGRIDSERKSGRGVSPLRIGGTAAGEQNKLLD